MCKPTYYECGICDHLHDARWDGDCRDDNTRFNIDDLNKLWGPFNWEEIEMGDIDEWRAQQR